MAEQTERVYREIKQRIVEAHYKPGMHFSEAVLARLHKASRTPVREALSQLLDEGYVARTSGRGWSVGQVTVNLIRDNFEVRRLLEAAAAARAAEVAERDEIVAMRELACYSYRVETHETYMRALADNLRFHLAIAAGTHNAMMVDLVRRCLTQMDRVLSLGVDYQPIYEMSSQRHAEIVAAIEARDAAAARRAMEGHLDESGALLMKAVLGGKIARITI